MNKLRSVFITITLILAVSFVSACSGVELAEDESEANGTHIVVTYPEFPDLLRLVMTKGKVPGKFFAPGGSTFCGPVGKVCVASSATQELQAVTGTRTPDSPIRVLVQKVMWYRVEAESEDMQMVAVEIRPDYGSSTQMSGLRTLHRQSLGLILHANTSRVHRAFVGIDSREEGRKGKTIEIEVAPEGELTVFDAPWMLPPSRSPGVGTMGGPDPLRIIDWDFALSRSDYKLTRRDPR